MNREEAYNAIKNYFEDFEEEYNEAIEEADSWDGLLGDDRYYYMEELDDLLHGRTATEILSQIAEGFDLRDDYIKFTIWGLESHEEKDYMDYLDTFVDRLLDGNYGDIEKNLPEEVQKVLEEYGNTEE